MSDSSDLNELKAIRASLYQSIITIDRMIEKLEAIAPIESHRAKVRREKRERVPNFRGKWMNQNEVTKL